MKYKKESYNIATIDGPQEVSGITTEVSRFKLGIDKRGTAYFLSEISTGMLILSFDRQSDAKAWIENNIDRLTEMLDKVVS